MWPVGFFLLELLNNTFVDAAEQADVIRLRRILAKDGQRLRIPRSHAAMQQLGIHVVDDHNNLVAWDCSIAQLLQEVQS